jgi:hypothetical protein
MKIQLRRAYTGDDLCEWDCAVCEVPFTVQTVYADVAGEEGEICDECLAYLHGRQPGVFPSVEVLRELRERYPAPVLADTDAAIRLERIDLGAACRLMGECEVWPPYSDKTVATTPLERVVEELAADKGIASLEELFAKILLAGGTLTLKAFREGPPMYLGDELDLVLRTAREQRDRISQALMETGQASLAARRAH